MSPTRSDVWNEDWVKTRCWDLWLGTSLVTTLAQLQQYLADQHLTLDHFLTLPAAVAMPASLRDDVNLYHQEQLADALDAPPEGKTVTDRLNEALERKDKVQTEPGARKYHEPIGALIIRHPHLSDAERSALTRLPSASLQDRIAKMFTERRRIEEAVTADVQATADAVGGEPIGLQFRLKKPNGVADKILRVLGRGSSEQQAGDITDALRYTISFPPERYYAGVRAAIRAMENRGFRQNGPIENNWLRGDAYNGINMLFRHPDGFKFEVQFHTPESFAVKTHANHKDYQFYRSRQGPPAARRAAWDRMQKNADAVAFPRGVLGLGTLIFRPFEP